MAQFLLELKEADRLEEGKKKPGEGDLGVQRLNVGIEEMGRALYIDERLRGGVPLG